MNERMRFVTRLEDGERMVDLCREFGISRKTGYKFWDRYRKLGPAGLFDDSRRPERSPNQTPPDISKIILDLKKEHTTWGAAKLREYLIRKRPGVRIPGKLTIHRLLDKHGFVKRQNQRRTGTLPLRSDLKEGLVPNDVWCADYKGQFLLGNSRYCYPLTVSDHFSRFLLTCEALDDTKAEPARAAFEATFKEFGLPGAIRSDNGTPFASTGLWSLSKLSVWWLRLGIALQRIDPGHPEQNGRHERMHLTLKQETTRPAGANQLQQQERFNNFRRIYNEERPHEALGMRCPIEVYRPSLRPYPVALPDPEYPLHDLARRVDHKGRLWMGTGNPRCQVSETLADELLGLREEDDGIWKLTFMNLDLGLIDKRTGRLEPFSPPSGKAQELSPMS